MIALFVHSADRFATVGRVLPSPTREVDGPYRQWRSEAGGAPLMVWLVEERADSAYAAARLAARRGATMLIPILEGVSTAAMAEREGFALGDVASVGAIHDETALAELQRMLPDSAKDLPVESLDDLLSPAALWTLPEQDADALTIATLAEPARNRALLRRIRDAYGAVLFDAHAAGYAAAAIDAAVPLRPLAIVSALLAATSVSELDALSADAAFDEVIRHVLGRG